MKAHRQHPVRSKIEQNHLNEKNLIVSSENNSKQAFWILLGSLSGFLFSIISAIILSRHFSKPEYGTYKQIIYIYDTLLIVFTLGLPKAYSFFLPRVRANQAKDLIKKINNILLGAGIIMGATIFFGSDKISELLKNEELSAPLKIFSIVPMLLLPTMGLEGILATFKKTQWLAIYNISTRALTLAFVALPVIAWDGDINSAISGFSAASFIVFLLASFLRDLPLKNINPEKSEISYREIFNYSFPLFLAGFWGILITSADQFFISHYFGTETFAEYSNGALQLPFVTMVIAATSIVLAPIYSKKAFEANEKSNSEIIRIWNSALSKTMLLTYPLVAFFICFSTDVMIALYGENYENSGAFFQLKLIVNFFTLIAYGPLMLSIGGNKFYYKVHMYGAILLIALQAISIKTIHSPISIVWISVVCQVGRIFAMLWFISKHFNIKIQNLIPWKLAAKILTPSVIIGYSIDYSIAPLVLNQNKLFTLALAGSLYIAIYLLWAYFSKIDYSSIVRPLIKKINHEKN